MFDIIFNGILGLGIAPLELMLCNVLFLAFAFGAFGLWLIKTGR